MLSFSKRSFLGLGGNLHFSVGNEECVTIIALERLKRCMFLLEWVEDCIFLRRLMQNIRKLRISDWEASIKKLYNKRRKIIIKNPSNLENKMQFGFFKYPLNFH